MDLKEAIRMNYLMRGLSPEDVDRIAAMAVVKEFHGGDTVVRQFDKHNDLIILVEGAIRVNTFSGEKIAEGGPGCVIGEISLLDEKPRSATVVSIGRSQCAVISSEKLWQAMNADPVMATKILRNLGEVLCMRLRSANLQLDTVIARDFARR